MLVFLTNHWLDIVTTVLGLAYILLEYKASVWMWLVGFLMQALGIVQIGRASCRERVLVTG